MEYVDTPETVEKSMGKNYLTFLKIELIALIISDLCDENQLASNRAGVCS